jgi:hypothetical protein
MNLNPETKRETPGRTPVLRTIRLIHSDLGESMAKPHSEQPNPEIAARVSAARKEIPLPQDAPLLSLLDVAHYLRLTPGALRRLVDGRRDGSDGEMGDFLRSWLVILSPRRRYVRREPFLSWLRDKSAGGTGFRAAG